MDKVSNNFGESGFRVTDISTDDNDSYYTVIKTMTTGKKNKDNIDCMPAPEQTSIPAFYLCGKAVLDKLKLNKIWIIANTSTDNNL